MKGSRSNTPGYKTQKFFFDQHIFDAPEPEDETPAEPPPPVFSEAELESVRKKTYQDAYNKGRQDATNEALASREHMITQVLQTIAQSWGDILEAETEREAIFERESVRLSAAIFEKLFPVYAQNFAFAELKSVITDIVQKQNQQSKITIHTHPDAVTGIEEHLKTLNVQMGGLLENRFEVLPLETLGGQSIRLSWKDGGAVRNIAGLADNISQILNDMLAGSEPKSHDVRRNDTVTDGDQP
jgi:hypothetical protein